jgi:hypothetical protein
MTISTSQTKRFRLEIRRSGELFETHGFFESIDAEQAADGNLKGRGDCMLGFWQGPDSAGKWITTAEGTTYRITRKHRPVTTAPQYQAVLAASPRPPLTDQQICGAVQMGWRRVLRQLTLMCM